MSCKLSVLQIVTFGSSSVIKIMKKGFLLWNSFQVFPKRTWKHLENSTGIFSFNSCHSLHTITDMRNNSWRNCSSNAPVNFSQSEVSLLRGCCYDVKVIVTTGGGGGLAERSLSCHGFIIFHLTLDSRVDFSGFFEKTVTKPLPSFIFGLVIPKLFPVSD